MKILIAEDDFINRFLLQKMFDEYGDITIVVNGWEAVEAYNLSLLEGNPFNLICLDIMMPEMDGKAALKQIRDSELSKGINPKDAAKIIMITALDTPKDVIDSYYNGGCDLYLVKPLEKSKIKEVLGELQLI